MKLYHSPTSPFVRIVRVALDHHKLSDAVDLASTDVYDEKARADFLTRNPIGKIPALELESGEVIYDSSVIVGYVDEIGRGPGLFDHDRLSPHHLKTLYALTNGMLDLAVSSVMETLRRPEDERSPAWLARWETGIQTSVDAMAQALPDIQDTRLMPDLAFPVALDYLAFRLPHIAWRERHPAMARWLDERLDEEIYRSTDPR